MRAYIKNIAPGTLANFSCLSSPQMCTEFFFGQKGMLWLEMITISWTRWPCTCVYSYVCSYFLVCACLYTAMYACTHMHIHEVLRRHAIMTTCMHMCFLWIFTQTDIHTCTKIHQASAYTISKIMSYRKHYFMTHSGYVTQTYTHIHLHKIIKQELTRSLTHTHTHTHTHIYNNYIMTHSDYVDIHSQRHTHTDIHTHTNA